MIKTNQLSTCENIMNTLNLYEFSRYFQTIISRSPQILQPFIINITKAGIITTNESKLG